MQNDFINTFREIKYLIPVLSSGQPLGCTALWSFQFCNNYFTEMCSDSEAGSHLRLIDFVHHSTLSLRVRKEKRKTTLCVWGLGRV